MGGNSFTKMAHPILATARSGRTARCQSSCRYLNSSIICLEIAAALSTVPPSHLGHAIDRHESVGLDAHPLR